MTSSISYDKIAGKTADDLFEEYSVEELGNLMTRLSDDVNTKKQKLKFLVGNKYRDLLNVADDIIKMNEITTVENEKLMKLAFKRSDYNSKSLSNLSKFNVHLQQIQVEKVRDENRSVILRNVVHDLNYSLITLKHHLTAELQFLEENYATANEISNVNSRNQQLMDLDENLDDYQTVSTPVSNGFIVLAKQIYLIRYYFSEEIENQKKLFAIVKYEQLCREFNNLLDSNFVRIKHEADSDFALNLFVSFLITNNMRPIEVVQCVLQRRLEKFENLATTNIPFRELLNYIFVTIQYISFIHTRIPATINKLQGTAGSSSWIQQTSFQKWSKWLHKSTSLNSSIENQSEYTFEVKSDRISKDEFQQIVEGWEHKVCQLLLANFNGRLDKSSDSLINLVIMLRYTLISFKHFTSLSTLLVNDVNIIDYFIEKWSKEYQDKLTVKLNEFEKICHLILETYNDEKMINAIVESSSESCLYEFRDDFEMGALLQFSGEKHSNDQVFILLDIFKQDLKSTSNSIDSLKALSTLVLKPLLSIDDFEDDDFWVEVSIKLKNILSKSVDTSISILNDSINKFFEKISSLLKKDMSGVSNTRIFYIIRILVQLEEKIPLGDFYDTFSNYSTSSIDTRIQLSELVEPLLEKYFQVIVDSVYNTKYANLLKNILRKRFEADKEYPEILLWESISESKSIPTTSSIEYAELLMSFCAEITTFAGKNYSNYFVLPSFEKVRRGTIKLLMDEISSFIKTFNDTELNAKNNITTSKLLLTYADFLFTAAFLNSEIDADLDDSKFTKVLESLTDTEYRKQIAYSILENYKNQSLMYYPLSS